MELDEFEILEWKSSTNDHGIPITSACVGASAAEVGSTISTSCQNRLVRAETMKSTILHVHGNNTNALSILHNQIKGEIFDEEVGVVPEGLAVKRMENSMACSISGRGTPVGLATFAVFQRLTTKCTLVYLSFLGSGEGHAKVFQL